MTSWATVGLLTLAWIGVLFGTLAVYAEGSGPGKPPDTPEGLEGTAIFVGGVDLEWTDVPGAESYEVQLFRNVQWIDLPGDGVEIAFYGAGAIISQLNHDGYTYWFQVRANNAKGSSEWSDPYLMQPTYHFEEGRKERPENVVATGAPTISGTAQVGKVLTADASGIEDGNGLDRVKFQYQWVSNDGTTDTDIEGATESAYRVRAAEEGKTLKVRVSFTDRHGYAESVTSAETATVLAAAPNVPPTGAPTISGPTHVSGTLTASVQGIDDQNGLHHATFRYRWIATDVTIETVVQDSEESAYTLAESDEGKTIRVEANFTDDDGYEETVVSVPTDSVASRPNRPATGLPAISGTVQVGETLTADTSGIEDADGLDRDRVTFYFRWIANDGTNDTELSYGPGTSGFPIYNYATYTLTVDDTGKTIRVQAEFNDGRGYRETVTSAPTPQVAPAPNVPADGVPTINGTPQVGRTLTVDASGISDDNGLDPTTFSYQWVTSDGTTDTDIAGADGLTYMVTADAVGQTIQVRVSFTDKAGYQETVTTQATNPAYGSDDHGGTPETATSLPYGSTEVVGQLHPYYEFDYFELEVTEEIVENSLGHILIDTTGFSPYHRHSLFKADGTCATLGCEEVRGVPGDSIVRVEPGTYYLRVVGPMDDSLPDSITANRTYAVSWGPATNYNDRMQSCTSIETDFDDAWYGCQDYLKNRTYPGEDINVEPVWLEGNLGEGIKIAVLDTGVDYEHEDLRDNVDVSRFAVQDAEWEPLFTPREFHGTAVAGIIAARDNEVGMRGVAPRATIYSYRFVTSGLIIGLDRAEANGLTLHHTDVAVSNNSRKRATFGMPDQLPRRVVKAIIKGITEGFDGKGTSYVFAAGNGESDYLDEYVTFYPVTTVCVVDSDGKPTWVSFSGDHLWVCAPEGSWSLDNGDLYRGFGATSSAAPIVSGVIALVRNANEDLTWRDVKLILAASARKNDPDHPDWERGALHYGSDDKRYSYNGYYGFGVVDAKAAVDLAKEWTNLPAMKTVSADSGQIDLTIPDRKVGEDPTTLVDQHTINSNRDTPNFIEHVEVSIEFDHPSFRDLEVQLVSPSGKVSTLSFPNDKYRGEPFTDKHRFGSAKHIGEDPAGVWTLRITDRIAEYEGLLKSWSIVARGHRGVSRQALPGNNPATGTPTIAGTARAGTTLRVDTSSIEDADGHENAPFSYQWLADDAVIYGATNDTYFLGPAVEGKTIRVRVRFTDDWGYMETLTSEATAVVAPYPDQNPGPTWSATMTVGSDIDPDSFGYSYARPWVGELSQNSFSLYDSNYYVKKVLLARTGRIGDPSWLMYFVVYPEFPVDFRLKVGTVLFFASEEGTLSIIRGDSGYRWYNATVSLSDGETVQVGLSTGNSPATGTPVINGTAQVGETITVDVTGIEDADGRTGATFSYQWLAADVEIAGATDPTYTLVADDASKAIKVRVSFTDDWEYEEVLTSAAATDTDRPNTPATSAPIIHGTAQVGETLMADTSGIDDADGMSGAVFSYQWLAGGVDIAGATDLTYTLVDDDAGLTIKVQVSFFDDKNNPETLTSAATAAVLANVPDAPEHLNVSLHDTGALDVSWEAPARDGGSDITGYKVQWKRVGDSWDTPADVFEATATGATHTITGLTDGVGYAVRIIAVNDVGDGPPSDEAMGTPRDTTSPTVTSLQWLHSTDGTDDIYTIGDELYAWVEFSEWVSNRHGEGTPRLRINLEDDKHGYGQWDTSWGEYNFIYRVTEGVMQSQGVSTGANPIELNGGDIEDAAGNDAILDHPGIPADREFVIDGVRPKVESLAITSDPGEDKTYGVGDVIEVSVTFSEGVRVPSRRGIIEGEYGEWFPVLTLQIGNQKETADFFEVNYTVVKFTYTVAVGDSASNGIAIPQNALSFNNGILEDDVGTRLGSSNAANLDHSALTADSGHIVHAPARLGGLRLLELSGIPLAFDPAIDNYSAHVANEVMETTVTATANDHGATYVVQLGGVTDDDRTVSLAVGENVITIEVTAEDDTKTRTYTITVTRSSNTPATGAPTVTGTAQVGETLTADISGIGDDDGLPAESEFDYQWIAGTTDISGATGSTYAPLVADLGKTITVRVSFDDDQNNFESLTSAATAAVAAKPNSPATGAPTISGTAQSGRDAHRGHLRD